MRFLVLSLLLFMGLATGRCSSDDSSEEHEEQYRKGGGDGSPRLILNPFNIFGNPTCFYNGDEGRCYGEVECLALAGNYGAFCPGLQGLCCLFYRTCNQRTSQETSYFRNLQWPLEDQAPNACTFKVIRRSDTYCGLRVEAEKVNLPPKAGSCTSTYVHVTGAGNHSPMPLCGRSTGINYSIDFRHVSEVSIHVNSSTRSSAAWNIKLTQIPCADFGGETGGDTSSSGGGIASAPVSGSAGGGVAFPPPSAPPTGSNPTTPRPATPPPTTARPTTAAPIIDRHTTPHPPAPSTFSSCGVKGRSTRRKRDADIVDGIESSEGVLDSRNAVEGRSLHQPPVEGRSLHQPPVIQRDNPFLKDWQYDGPYLNDSRFYYYQGSTSFLNSRITFGADTSIREYPWQVAMFVGGRYHCGASIIGDWFILTAAHCVVSYQVNPSVLRLSLGDWDVSNNQDGEYLEARVAIARVHPSYSRSTLQNDLAVLKLTKRIDYSERVRAVCLPDSDIPTDGEQATVTGWGRDENKRLKSKLQELTAIITTNNHCGERWMAKKAPAGFIANTMMCMDAANGDSCNGDSGGPSVMEIPPNSGHYVQVGIVSFGSGSCTESNLPGVYTRVSKFRDWIRQQMY